MDGTFKSVPSIFYQLFSIHGVIGPAENFVTVPLVFALMTGKSEYLYSKVFSALVALGDRIGRPLTPRVIISDFESGIRKALFRNFPAARHTTCLFHLCHSLNKHLTDKGYMGRYKRDADFASKVRMIGALAFLDPLSIPAAFEEVKVLRRFIAILIEKVK